MQLKIMNSNFFSNKPTYATSLVNRLLLFIVFTTLFLQQTAATKLFSANNQLALNSNLSVIHKQTAIKSLQSPIPLSPLSEEQFFESETDEAEDDNFLASFQYTCLKEKYVGFTYSQIQQHLRLKSYLAHLKIEIHQRSVIPFFLLHQSWKDFIG